MNNSEGTLFTENLLAQIRERFAHVDSDPMSDKRIYFENSGGSLTLKSVIEAVTMYTGLPDNAGRRNPTSREIDLIIHKGIEDIKTFMGVKSGVVALGESTTVNAYKTITPIISNIPGGNVVTTDLDHPAVYDSTRIICDRYGKEWRTVPLRSDKGIVDTESILQKVDTDTIALAIIHSSNNIGTRNDIFDIVRKVRNKNPDVYVIVDGSQYCMHSLIDVEDIGCDVYLVSSYKTYNKIGAAAVYLSERASKIPHDKLIGKAQDYWELGTREPAGYAGWSRVIDYFCWIGSHFTGSTDKRELVCSAMHAIDSHDRALLHRMLNGTDKLKGMRGIEYVKIYGEVEDLTIKDSGLLFNVEGMTSAEVVSVLEERGIRVTERKNDYYSGHTLRPLGIESGVRVSLAHYNTPKEIDYFLEVLSEVWK